MNISVSSGIDNINTYKFFGLNYPNLLFFVGKINTAKESLESILLDYKNKSLTLPEKELLNVHKFIKANGINNLSIFQIESDVSTTEDQAIRIKSTYIKQYRLLGFVLQNEIYNGSTYKMVQEDVSKEMKTDIYVGSTEQPLTVRMSNHFVHSEGNNHFGQIYDHMRKLKLENIIVYNNLKLELIEFYELEFKNELRCMEQRCIEEFKKKGINLLNTNNAFSLIDKKEYRKEYKKEYYEENKEKLNQQEYEKRQKYINEGIFSYSCFYCEVIMYQDDKFKHDKTIKHSDNIKECHQLFENITKQLSIQNDNNAIKNWYENLSVLGKEAYNLWKENPDFGTEADIHYCNYCDFDVTKSHKIRHEISEIHFKNIIKWNLFFEHNYQQLIKVNEKAVADWKSTLTITIREMFNNWLIDPNSNLLRNKIDETKFHCIYCNSTMHAYNKDRHLETLVHQNKVKITNEQFANLFQTLSEDEIDAQVMEMTKDELEMFNNWYVNKDKIVEIKLSKKCKCYYCNIDISTANKAQHKKTKKHIQNVEKQNLYFTSLNQAQFSVWYNSFEEPIKEMYNIWYKEKLLQK